jgi:hypothetical protein
MCVATVEERVAADDYQDEDDEDSKRYRTFYNDGSSWSDQSTSSLKVFSRRDPLPFGRWLTARRPNRFF